MNTQESVNGPVKAVAGTGPIASGTISVVWPRSNIEQGSLLLRWKSEPGATLRVPDLAFGATGSVDARAAGATLCWCPDPDLRGRCPVQDSGQPGERCLELNGTVDITRYALVDTDLGGERDVDILLDVSGVDADASAALQLHIVIKDDLFTVECAYPKDPISWLPRTRHDTEDGVACR